MDDDLTTTADTGEPEAEEPASVPAPDMSGMSPNDRIRHHMATSNKYAPWDPKIHKPLHQALREEEEANQQQQQEGEQSEA